MRECEGGGMKGMRMSVERMEEVIREKNGFQ